MKSQEFVVLVPLKPLARAKSRLAELGDARRRTLAEAFVLDTVAAALAATRVAAVLVVTDDHRLAATVRARGCQVVPDGVSDDLNRTLVLAAAEARRRWPDTRPMALCADLPALTPEGLDQALASALDTVSAFVPDAAGTGTTLYTAAYDDFAPRFGTDSRRAHAAAGAVELDAHPGLRADVDSPADLGRALLHGVGVHTAQATGRA